MQGKQPDPRWANFTQQFHNGVAIGFKIEGNDFLFVYDEQGGWVDEQGKYFDTDGVPIDEEFEGKQNDDYDSEIDDDEIVDEFEQMLMEEEQGIIRSKPNKEKKEPQPISSQISEDQESKKWIQRLIKKQELRQGLSSDVWIFFKIKSNLYQRIQYEVEKRQDVISKNALIKEIKAKADIKKTELLTANKWLQGDFFLDYSGVSLDQGVYDRYWYGWIKVTPQNYFSTIQQIKKSNQFSILQSKTLYALKSKFFLKNKMKQTISKLKESLNGVAEDGAVLVKINNLPQEFPLSLILDLIQLSGGYLEDVEDIEIIDNFSADMIVKKRTAELLTNIEGYAHSEKEFIWLQIESENRPIKFNKLFNIEIDAEYKPLLRETGDVLGLEWSSQEMTKSYDKGQKFRLAINQGALRKILMFRGESLNVVRIVRFEKKE